DNLRESIVGNNMRLVFPALLSGTAQICLIGEKASPFHLAEEDFRLSNLIREEGMKKTVSAKKPMSKTTVEKASKLAPAPKTKASKERPSKASADKPPKPKPAKEKSTKTTLPQSTGKGKVVKVCKTKSLFQLVDEPYEELAHSEPIPELIDQGEGDEDNIELAIQMSLESFQAQSQAQAVWPFESLLQRPPDHS
nr:hypothetical protein [Tanacetum cinerariifolium]